MIRAGFETTDPITNTRTIVIQGAEETEGRGWVLEVHCPEGAPPAIMEHVHLGWTETFEILGGSAAYTLDGQQQVAEEGEIITMRPGLKHVHPWNIGSGEMVYRQSNDFGAVSPDAVHEVLGVFATINGLAGEGKIGMKGLPKNPLQLAACLRLLAKHEGFDAALPIAAQRFVSATLGRLAERLGYHGADPRFTS